MLKLLEWNRLYNIESKINTLEYTQDDVRFLVNLIWKLNGNIIDPRTHNKMQEMIDRIEIPEVNIDFDEETKQAMLNYLERYKVSLK
jgi:hypothetical protein